MDNIELHLAFLRPSLGRTGVEVTLSIPGRRGAVRRQWASAGPSLTASELEDLLAYIEGMVMDWYDCQFTLHPSVRVLPKSFRGIESDAPEDASAAF